MCRDAAYSVTEIEPFVLLALGGRRRAVETLREVSRLVGEYILFARMRDPSLPIGGTMPKF